MAKHVKPIRTDDDYEHAVARIEALWDAAPGTAAADEVDVLAVLVDAYERVRFPIPAPDPIEAIRFRMDQQGLTEADLLPIFRTRTRTWEIMHKRRPLSLAMIRTLAQKLSMSPEHLVREYRLKPTGTAKPQARPSKMRAAPNEVR